MGGQHGSSRLGLLLCPSTWAEQPGVSPAGFLAVTILWGTTASGASNGMLYKAWSTGWTEPRSSKTGVTPMHCMLRTYSGESAKKLATYLEERKDEIDKVI